MGQVGILNVGAGDTKLIFDKDNPQDMIRAARIVKDMLRRGYALLVQVDGRFQRATDFREDVCEYVIADFDPVAAQEAGREEESKGEAASAPASATAPESPAKPRRGRPRTRGVPATGTNAIAVARTAGG